jgi:hypothetical protein
MSILMIADYYLHREKDTASYFKVNARNIDGTNVFKGRGDDDDDSNLQLRRQRSQDRHVAILKQINDEMYLRRLYNGNFDKLAAYCNEHELYHSPLKGKTVIRDDRSCIETFVNKKFHEDRDLHYSDSGSGGSSDNESES